MKLRNVLLGWKYVIWKDDKQEKMAQARAEICNTCPDAKQGNILQMIGDEIKEIQGHYCDQCKCPLSALLRSEDSKCELNKW